MFLPLLYAKEIAERNGRRWFVVVAFLAALMVSTVSGLWGMPEHVHASEPAPVFLEIRFRDGVDLFRPQETVALEVRPKGNTATLSADQARTTTLNLSLYRYDASDPPQENADSQGGFHSASHSGSYSGFSLTVPGISGRKTTSSSRKDLVFEQELSVSIRADQPPIPVTFLAPDREGIYTIVVSLQVKNDVPASALGNSLRSLSTNPLQRPVPKTVAQTVCHCVVVDPTSSADRDRQTNFRKELLDNFDTPDPVWWKRWPGMPSLPKMTQFSSPKLPEIPRLTGFRERPSAKEPESSGHSSDQPSGKSGEPYSAERASIENPATNTWINPFSPNIPACVVQFLEQYRSRSGAPYSSGHFKHHAASEDDPESDFSRLAATQSEDRESWEAFPLKVGHSNRPHLLEFDYPVDRLQSLGIIVLDLLEDTVGGTMPVVSLDASFYVADEIVSDRGFDKAGSDKSRPISTATHRALFWPKTKQPILLIANRSRNRDVLLAGMRLYQLEEKPNDQSSIDLATDPRNQGTIPPVRTAGASTRMIAGYVHRSDFLEYWTSSSLRPVSASMFPGEPPCPTDWPVFHQGATRLVDLLGRNGYNGVLFNVASKDGVLYPSRTLYYASEDRSATVPQRSSAKDVLELLSRLSDRDGLAFIPAIDFNMPLPAIENRLYCEPTSAEQLLCGVCEETTEEHSKETVETKTESKTAATARRYNILHPVVQEAMLEVVAELAGRCAAHPSFSGIGMILTPDGYARLSDPFLFLDDWTVERFQRETGVVLPDGIGAIKPNPSPGRFAERRQYFRTNYQVAEAWIDWRAQKTHEFYERIAKTVASHRPDAMLYLAGGTMLDKPELRRFCMPTLFGASQLPNALRMLGFDPLRFRQTESLVFLRPNRVSETNDSEASLVYGLFASPEFARFQGDFARNDGVLFLHDTRDGFQGMPVSRQARRHFVRQLALSDADRFFDSGFLVPTAETDSSDNWRTTIRRWPSTRPQTYIPPDAMPEPFSVDKTEREKTLQPVTIRYAADSSNLFVCLINDAPFQVRADVAFQCRSEATIDSGHDRKFTPLEKRDGLSRWTVELEPYDIVVASLNDAGAVIADVQIHRPAEICGNDGTLKQTVDRLSDRIRTAQRGIAWTRLANAGCEPLGKDTTEILGWERFGAESVQIRIDLETKRAGRSSFRLTRDESQEVGAIYSGGFAAPPTGRLFTAVDVGIPAEAASIPLEIVLAGKQDGKPFFRMFDTEPETLRQLLETTPVNGVRWLTIVVPFDQLPVENVEDMRIGFVLSRPGTVWIDEIKLYQVAFTKDEMNILYRLVSVADRRCSSQRVSELLTMLEGPWARFLFRHVPESEVGENEPATTAAAGIPELKATARPSEANPKTASEAGKKSTSPGFFDRVKGWFRP